MGKNAIAAITLISSFAAALTYQKPSVRQPRSGRRVERHSPRNGGGFGGISKDGVAADAAQHILFQLYPDRAVLLDRVLIALSKNVDTLESAGTYTRLCIPRRQKAFRRRGGTFRAWMAVRC